MFKKLLNISDLNKTDIEEIFKYSSELNVSKTNDLLNKSIGLIFEKHSTRTRLSFQVGISQLGGNPINIRLEELNLQRVETFEDTFKILSQYLDAIVFRTTSHDKLIKASKYFNKPIINGLSDISHPCQIISDFYTLKNHFKDLNKLSICWFGDMNNVLFSYFEFLKLFTNIQLHVFTNSIIYENKINDFPLSENINIHFNIDKEIISQADCIMTDVFTSMNDSTNDNENLLSKFQVNKDLMKLTKDSAIFMHCLPANIGIEVTNDVLESSQSVVLIQAKNRLIAQKGILKWLKI